MLLPLTAKNQLHFRAAMHCRRGRGACRRLASPAEGPWVRAWENPLSLYSPLSPTGAISWEIFKLFSYLASVAAFENLGLPCCAQVPLR